MTYEYKTTETIHRNEVALRILVACHSAPDNSYSVGEEVRYAFKVADAFIKQANSETEDEKSYIPEYVERCPACQCIQEEAGKIQVCTVCKCCFCENCGIGDSDGYNCSCV